MQSPSLSGQKFDKKIGKNLAKNLASEKQLLLVADQQKQLARQNMGLATLMIAIAGIFVSGFEIKLSGF